MNLLLHLFTNLPLYCVLKAHASNPSTLESEEGISEKFKPAWFTKIVLRQLVLLHRENLFKREKKNFGRAITFNYTSHYLPICILSITLFQLGLKSH